MKKIKPLSISVALLASLFCVGTAVAGHSTEPELVVASGVGANAPASDSQTVVSSERKIYYFAQLDVNHDGRLSRSEIPKDMHSLRRNFVRADFDGDGLITAQEYTLYANGQAPQYVGIYHTLTFVYPTADRFDDGLVADSLNWSPNQMRP